MLYRTVLPDDQADPVNLSVPGIRDRGYVMINKVGLRFVKRVRLRGNVLPEVFILHTAKVNTRSGLKFRGFFTVFRIFEANLLPITA